MSYTRSNCKKIRKKVAYCFYGFCGSIGHANYIQNKKMEEIMININYKHFKKYVLDVNKNVDIDIFLLSYNTDSKEHILNLYKPIKSKFMKPKIDFDFFNHEKYKSTPEEHIESYNRTLLSRLYGLFKFGQMLKKHTENNNLIYDNIILSRFDIAFQKEFNLDIHINNDIKLIKSFNSVYPPRTVNNWPPYSEKNLEFVNQGLPNPNKNILLLGYDHTFKVNENIFMGNMNCIYQITLLYPILCELNNQDNFVADSHYGNQRFSINPHYLFSYIILGLASIYRLKISYLKDLYYDIPIAYENECYIDSWMEKVTTPITRLVYLKSTRKIGDTIIKSDKIREFFNFDDFKDIGLSEEELELIK